MCKGTAEAVNKQHGNIGELRHEARGGRLVDGSKIVAGIRCKGREGGTTEFHSRRKYQATGMPSGIT